MADLNVNSIGDASGGTTATVNGFTPTVSNMAGRNRIINGDMRIDQRNAGASVTGHAVYSVDRFFQINNVVGCTYSVQQDSSAPQGFTNSLKVTITAAASPVSATQVNLRQYIEGFNTADLNWGTANAKTVTLSFWVKSSLTGTFGGSLVNDAFNRVYAYEYIINSANTWEYKTVTITGDTTGTWETGNSTGIRVLFGLGATDYSLAAGVWSSGYAAQTPGSVDLCATNGATWQITGVQLEEGSVATPFEHRQYGQELALCKRYFEKSYDIGTVPGSSTYAGVFVSGGGATGSTTSFIGSGNPVFTVEKRATPTTVIYDTAGTANVLQRWQLGVINSNGQSVVVTTVGTNSLALYSTSGTNASGIQFHWTASAEL